MLLEDGVARDRWHSATAWLSLVGRLARGRAALLVGKRGLVASEPSRRAGPLLAVPARVVIVRVVEEQLLARLNAPTRHHTDAVIAAHAHDARIAVGRQ